MEIKINSLGIDSSTLDLSRHAKKTLIEKGFTLEQVLKALRQPYKVTDVSRYPGQKRFCGGGLAVIVNMKAKVIVTMYLDGVRTPLRADQMNDPAALASQRALR